MGVTLPAKVDTYMNSHLMLKGTAPYDILQRIHDNSLERGLDDISVSPAQGKFLALQARLAQAENILEVGTLGAYSTVWFTAASPDTKITSIEIDPHTYSIAQENVSLTESSVSSRINLILGNAIEVLPGLLSEIQSSSRPHFDFIFIDADKQNNLAYFNYAARMAKPGALVIVDNVVRGGLVVDESACQNDGKVIGTRELIEAMKYNERVDDAVVIQTEGEKGYDGFLMVILK
ncbi:O-methyltransferase [Talaromyces proteolyticus]|uniref:O-methyltransferase n=1 Tax=Talaromyces proteolyticus TaxID=1131652 RepID=A0AAD4L232_9EURO|nr:O-methyltransferase [Talaromyces proteolyticus]KAH8704130.1 O-methyltransferase [Talaromyces proteolyticus]